MITADHDYNERKTMGSLDKIKLTTGKILKAMRLRFGYTQKGVSSAIGISTSNLSELENDKLKKAA